MKKNMFYRLLRPMLAVLLVMAMVLCCGCNPKQDEEDDKTAEVVTPLGDGDGKLEAQDVVDGATTIYGNVLGAMGGQTSQSSHSKMDIDITLGEDALDYINEMMAASDMPFDGSWLKEFGLNLDVNYNKDLMKMVMELQLGNTSIISAEVIQDMVGQMMYACLPGLNDEYIGVNLGDLGMDMSAAAGMISGMEQYSDVVSALPTEEALNKLLSGYLELALNQLDDPVESTETLALEGISQEVTVTTHILSVYDVMDITEAVMKAAQTDEELEKLLDDLSAYVNEMGRQEAQMGGYYWADVDLHEELMYNIEMSLEDLADARQYTDDLEVLQLSVFAAGEKQVGFRMRVSSGDEMVDMTMDINCYHLNDNGDTALLVEIPGMFRFSGTGSLEDGIAEGDYTLNLEGMDMIYVGVKDFDVNALKQGDLKGVFTLSLSDDAIMESFGYGSVVSVHTKFEVSVDLDDKGGTTAFKLYEGTAFQLGITLTTKILSEETIKVPSNYVDAENMSQMEQWAMDIDFAKLLQNLRKAGMPVELVDLLEMNLPM